MNISLHVLQWVRHPAHLYCGLYDSMGFSPFLPRRRASQHGPVIILISSFSITAWVCHQSHHAVGYYNVRLLWFLITSFSLTAQVCRYSRHIVVSPFLTRHGSSQLGSVVILITSWCITTWVCCHSNHVMVHHNMGLLSF